MHLCYMCDYVYLGTRVCPLCKNDRRNKEVGVVDTEQRRNDFCCSCRDEEQNMTSTNKYLYECRSTKRVIDEVRTTTNRKCDVCAVPEFMHDEFQAFVTVKHNFRSSTDE